MAAPDRIERAATVVRRTVVPVLALLVAVAAVVVGGAVQDATLERTEGVVRVDAVILERPAGGTARAVWPVPDGGSRIGVLSVSSTGAAPTGGTAGTDATVGATVPLWVDRSGTPVRPREPAGARALGIRYGSAVLGAGAGALLLVYAGAGWARRRCLPAEWAVVEPRWSGRAAR